MSNSTNSTEYKILVMQAHLEGKEIEFIMYEDDDDD